MTLALDSYSVVAGVLNMTTCVAVVLVPSVRGLRRVPAAVPQAA